MAEKSHISICEKADYRSYIDGWRGVAALMVLAVHTSQHVGNDGQGIFSIMEMEKVLNSGARGVQLFFILSAFTLFNSSLRRFNSESHPKRNFYLRRGFRIMPLWLIVTVLYLYLGEKSLLAGALSATFLFGFVRFDTALEVVPVGWSLFVEETFYLMLPFIFARLTSLGKAASYTIILLILSVVWMYLPSWGVPVTTANSYTFLFPLNHWYIFGIGIMLYHRVSDPKYQIPARKWLLDLLAFCVLPVVVVEHLSVVSTMFAFCILVSSIEGTMWNRIMNSSLLRRFGVYCYSIYLLHLIILRYTELPLKSFIKTLGLQDAPVDVKFLIAFPIVAAISYVVGYCCFNLIEKPSVIFGKKVIERWGLKGTSPVPQAEEAA